MLRLLFSVSRRAPLLYGRAYGPRNLVKNIASGRQNGNGGQRQEAEAIQWTG